MNGIILKLKKLWSNKNTRTIISLVIIFGVLLFGYTYRINVDKTPIAVPIANKDIQPRTKIDEGMIEYVKVPKGLLVDTVYQTAEEIIGQYTSVNTKIPKGSLFYKGAIANKLESADSYIDQIPQKKDKKYTLFYLPVNMETSYANSILPGRFIDIYVETTDESLPAVGRFITNVKVLAVKDAEGNNVFENSDERRVPSQVIFAVPEEQHLLLRIASAFEKVDGVPDMRIAPVPTGYVPKNVNTWVEPKIVNDQIRAIIEEYSVALPESFFEENTTNKKEPKIKKDNSKIKNKEKDKKIDEQ